MHAVLNDPPQEAVEERRFKSLFKLFYSVEKIKVFETFFRQKLDKKMKLSIFLAPAVYCAGSNGRG